MTMVKQPDSILSEAVSNESLRGFVVHAWAKSNQVRMAGRLENGQSFALLLSPGKSVLLVAHVDFERASQILQEQHLPTFALDSRNNPPHESFDGTPLAAVAVDYSRWNQAADQLKNAGIRVWNDSPRMAEDILTANSIKGLAVMSGTRTVGKRVDLVFVEPIIQACDGPIIPLHWLALDIETARAGTVRAISLVSRHTGSTGSGADSFAVAEVLFRGPVTDQDHIRSFATEAGLLSAFIERVQAIDPDVITGWNVIDFDLDVLNQRCAAHGIPFLLGRSDEAAKIEKRAGMRTKAFIPGRQAVDAMQLVRGSGTRYEDQTLDTVASGLLGIGKTVHARGEDKIQELDRLYQDEPAAFCNYCLEDSRLVIRILEKTGLHSLTQNRAALTGVGLDLAWTSIPTFERIYAMELWQRGILPPAKDEQRAVSGASGGMVLNPKAGLFRNVLVFDFRSLYPSIMRTFGIDPLAHERCRLHPQSDDIIAPNNAHFRREAGILPALIGTYFDERSRAQAAGDETAAFVYKILMNSFYGVLGSPGCRYGRTELAGAITSFGRFWLEYSRDFFEAAGYRVLYGDTDSVFVATGFDDDEIQGSTILSALGQRLAETLNAQISREIRQRFDLHSYLVIRSEKIYRRFLIPRMRSPGQGTADADASRGRAKGYAGLLLGDGGATSVEVKGMEAARSDSTALARRFQMELLSLVFADKPSQEINRYIESLACDLRAGKLDQELIYRKQLRRNAIAYEYSETPPVKAARMLGWTNRRGTVEYFMTTAGAEPLGMVSHAIDYEHYVGHQLLPIWNSIADAAGIMETSQFDRQAEFDWGS